MSAKTQSESDGPSASTADSSTATGAGLDDGPVQVPSEDEWRILDHRMSPWTRRERLGRVLWTLIGRPLFRASFHTWDGYRAAILRLFGARVGQGVRIRPTVKIEIPWNLAISDCVSVGDGVILYALGNIEIGPRSIVSQYAHLCAGTHDYRDPRFPLLRSEIVIESDVWIGTDSFVGPDVKVGRLVVLGARSSAYQDLESGLVYVGNPARPIKKRECLSWESVPP